MKINDNTKKALILGAVCTIAYLAVYVARNVLSTVTTSLIDIGYNESYIGRISSSFFIFYAVGQLLNGIIGDKIKAKYMMCLGLLFAGVTNTIFPFVIANSFGAILIYGLTGFFLSMIYAPMTKVVSESMLPTHGTRCAVAYSFAAAFGSPVAGALALMFTWQSAFAVSGGILAAMAVMVFAIFGLLERQKYVKYGIGTKKEKGEKLVDGVKVLLKHQIVRYSFVSILTGIVRTSVVFWLPTYIANYLEYGKEVSISIYSVITLVISLNAFFAVFVFERFKRSLEKTELLTFGLSTLFFLLTYLVKIPIINVMMIGLAIFMACSASSMMWTEYCLSLRETGLVSSATGYLDFLSYAAAAVANILFADASSAIGWGNLVLVWTALMLIGVIICLPKKLLRKKVKTENIEVQ